MNVELLPIQTLTAHVDNPRRDLQPGDVEYENIARSIQTWGLVVPLIWNRTTGRLVSGHQRLKILQAEGHTVVPCVVIEATEAQEREMLIALNRIEGQWDDDKLRAVLMDLSQDMLELTGFSDEEVAKLLNDAGTMGSVSKIPLDDANIDTEHFSLRCEAGLGKELRQAVKEIAKRNPDPDDIAPDGWALAQVIDAYERDLGQ